MPRKSFLLWGALSFLALAAQAQTVDEILAKHYAARGGLDKIKAVKSARMTLKLAGPGGEEMPGVREWKRPNLLRTEFSMQGMTGVVAYDGTVGWMVMPFMGKKDAEKMSEDDLNEARDDADFDGELVDYKAKGHTVEFLGKESVEGTEAYKLRVTKKNGDVETIYIDTESNLEFKRESKHKVRGQEIELELSLGDYKTVDGVVLPTSLQAHRKGGDGPGQSITVTKIELNVDIPDARFKMPEVKKEEPVKKQGLERSLER